ncbi:MAG: pilus assembly PilX N-terminal domain-containing protein [Phycisphaerae bacterium]|nr:pilus assembly PilX N-terminal domain-containing protein [Phycisphaerae bacterium]MDD5380877.1 pilus assembly PilX N-terminal domain-containing protein [Phycisphaerae bacterium]
MKPVNKVIYPKNRGSILIISMIFVLVFCALAVSMASLSGVNLQITGNQRKANTALSAAQSGLECGRYIIKQTTLTLAGIPSMSNGLNYVTQDQANIVWATLCSQIQNQPWVTGNAAQTENEIVTPAINFGAANASFQVRFCRDANSIQIEGIGVDGQVRRQVRINSTITKDNEVLTYAIASRGRMWLAGDSTIHGNVYSSWQYQDISPFNISSESTIDGTINTILSNINPNTNQPGPDLYADKFDKYGNPVLDAEGNRVKIKMPYDLETLDANGNTVYDSEGNRVISPGDQIQGQCDDIGYNVNYGDKAVDMPGMKISDYDTSQYQAQTTALSITGIPTVTEYFPHAAGNYSLPSSSGSQKLSRYKYENQTFSNKKVSAYSISSGVLKSTLFKNCTFEGILYLDCSTTGSTYNNVRFENCTFNGPIITNTPDYANSTNWWMRNCLYFTGEETFQNNTNVPATILAPNFNVNLGNTNPNNGENNVLTGAIVGGIVDIRGNAEIYGTVISMYDTSSYSSGYVSNIGATADDGGSETTEPGDIGVINITPDLDELLPSGVISPIVIKASQDTYSEGQQLN